MTALTEDDFYRSSTQYRFWAFTPQSLANLRASTNTSAANGVKAAMANLHKQEQVAGQDHNAESSEGENKSLTVDCLTVEEEQKLVGFYCVRAMQLADFCDFPTNVKATAVQFLKRFYLFNSPMTYHPKELMPSVLFLSTKTENHYTALKNFVSKLSKITAEDVIAPEFLLTQGLRFTFDVRHPQRGLEGGFMEFMALAKGQRGEGLKNEMLNLGGGKYSKKSTKSTEDLVQRIQEAHGRAKETLKTSALLTDVYFHHTPAQIWLSAFLLADEPLTSFYVRSNVSASADLKDKLTATLKSCSAILESSPSADPGEGEMKELMKIDKKLYKCRNPEKMDLVSINKAQKRDGEDDAAKGPDEKTIKKRKLERQKAEQESDNIFGPALGGNIR